MPDARILPTHLVVMGVSGTGKSTVAAAVAQRLSWRFGEGDAFHAAEHVVSMAAGVPLSDADRAPWLDSLAEWIAEHDREGRSTVLACSALRRAYRDVLRGGADRVRFVQLTAPSEVLAARLAGRAGHFMPVALLDSQLRTLEDLQSEEDGLVLDVRASPDLLVDSVVRWLGDE